MNEDQAGQLFAPAREKPVPPATFAMSDVFAEAAQLRRRRQLTASLGAVAAVLIAVLGAFLAASPGANRARPASPTGLLALVQGVRLPADAAPLATDPYDEADPNAEQPGFVEQQRFWTTRATPAAAIATMTAHQPEGLAAAGTGQGTSQGLNFLSADFEAAETATVEGPHLSLWAQAQPDGRTALMVRAWQITKPAKTGDETVAAVTSVTMTNQLGSASVTGAEAQRLAADLNALWVTVAAPSHGCSGGGSAEVTFSGAAAKRSYLLSCGRLTPEPATHQPQLQDSTTLDDDLARSFPSLFAAPVASTAPSPVLSDLGATLDQLPAPPGAKVTPPVTKLWTGIGVDNDTDVRSEDRFWTSPLSQGATVAWLEKHLSARWRGGFDETSGDQRVGTYYGPASLYEYGPNLVISVVATSSGSAYVINVSEQPLAAKTADERLVAVTAVTLSARSQTSAPTQPPLQTVHLTGAAAERLAADVNALVVPQPGQRSCAARGPDVVLDFTTPLGHRQFLDDQSCGSVTLLRGSGPGLDASRQFYDDVNAALKTTAN